MIVPAAIGGILEIALQALFFYWFLVITRLTLGADWAMAVVLLAVNWIPSFFLLIIVDRYIGVAGRHLGRSAPPSGKAPAAAPSARHACDRARRARSRHRACSIGRGRRAAGCRPGCAPGCAGTSARRRRCGSPRRRASTSSWSSVLIDEAAWQAAERKLLKSWWPISSRAASAMAAASSGTGTCQTRPRSSAGGARRFRIR